MIASRPRLVLLAASLPSDMTGGMQIQAEMAASELARCFDVVVLTRAIRSRPGVDHSHAYTVIRKRVLPVPGLRVLFDALQSMWYVHRVGRSARALLCYQTLSSGLIGVIAGTLFGVRTLVFIRGEEEFLFADKRARVRRLSLLTWRLADRVLVQSQRLRSAFVVAAAASGAAPSSIDRKTGVVPNGVSVRSQRPAPDAPDTLITVARLHPTKGHAVLFEALRGISAGDRPRLLLIGDGPLEPQLRAAADGLPVSFLGDLPHEQVLERLSEGGIFVLPSIEEGAPNVILEALAHGLPIIATHVGGIPDLVQDGVNTLLVPAGDGAALRGAIQRLRCDDQLRNRLSGAGPTAAATFSPQALGRRLEAEIEHLRPRLNCSLTLLRGHLERRHAGRSASERGALVGPDPNGRLTLRMGRFLPDPTHRLQRRDKVYMQAVGYWTRLHSLLANLDPASAPAYEQLVRASADYILRQQGDRGAWQHSDGSRRVATFDSTWGSIGLLEAYWTTSDATYLHASQHWIEYLQASGSIRPYEQGHYVGYWSDRDIVVPNISAELLWLASEQAKVEPTAELDRLMAGLIRFLSHVQQPWGELPYRVANASARNRPHYLCFQYNAFEFLALARYAENTDDPLAEPVLIRLANFLLRGVSSSGACRSSCSATYPEVDYYAAALALALRRAEALVGGRARTASDRLVAWLLNRQHADGHFGYSRMDYGLSLLHDRHSYPRPQAILAYSLAALDGLDNGRIRFARRAGVAL